MNTPLSLSCGEPLPLSTHHPYPLASPCLGRDVQSAVDDESSDAEDEDDEDGDPTPKRRIGVRKVCAKYGEAVEDGLLDDDAASAVAAPKITSME